LKDIDYTVKDRTLFEKLLDIEFSDVVDRGFFYNDNGHSFDAVIYHGHELTLVIFDMLMFCVIDFASSDFVISAVFTYIIDKVVSGEGEVRGRSVVLRHSGPSISNGVQRGGPPDDGGGGAQLAALPADPEPHTIGARKGSGKGGKGAGVGKRRVSGPLVVHPALRGRKEKPDWPPEEVPPVAASSSRQQADAGLSRHPDQARVRAPPPGNPQVDTERRPTVRSLGVAHILAAAAVPAGMLEASSACPLGGLSKVVKLEEWAAAGPPSYRYQHHHHHHQGGAGAASARQVARYACPPAGGAAGPGEALKASPGPVDTSLLASFRDRYLGAAAPPFGGMGPFLGPPPPPPPAASFLGPADTSKGLPDPRRISGKGSSSNSPPSPPDGALAPHPGSRTHSSADKRATPAEAQS
ncbi:hypothetical protein HPB47_026903, partial [Ixodes persulcatus]